MEIDRFLLPNKLLLVYFLIEKSYTREKMAETIVPRVSIVKSLDTHLALMVAPQAAKKGNL